MKRSAWKSSLRSAALAVLCLNGVGIAQNVHAAEALPATLAPPFDVTAIRMAAGEPVKSFKCDPVPPAVVELSMNSKYARKPGSAEIDPAKLKANEEATAPITAFVLPLIADANLYVRSRPVQPEIARCVMKWIAGWARKDAMTVATTGQGEIVRAWNLAIIALAYLQVESEPQLRDRDRERVRAWIGDLAGHVVDDFNREPERGSRRNNHRYWAAWAVMTAALVLNDRTFYEWAVEGYRIGIRQVTAEGFLPLELDRRQRSLGYHIYAAEPLVMIAETAARNGQDLYGEEQGALHRLIRRSLDGLSDPTPFEAKVGLKQDISDAATASKMAWLVPYERRFGGTDLDRWRKTLKEFKSSKLGGDVDFLYGAPPAPTL